MDDHGVSEGLARLVERRARDGIERAGLVRQERPASDRRVIDVVITARGLDVLHAARPFHRDDV
jgi:DNA-binding MarR family transcriptional regulator